MHAIIKYYLPVYLGLFFLATFVFTSVRFYRLHDINPIRFSKEDNAYNFVGRLMLLMMLLIAIVIGFRCSGREYYEYLAPFHYLEYYYLQVAGLVLIHVFLVWILVAQLQMGVSWRIGIDVDNKTKLVDSGIFRISRNPIYVGIIFSFCGLFLILPNAFSLLVVVLGFATVNIQVRLEEEFLTATHGKEYDVYKAKVRRWL